MVWRSVTTRDQAPISRKAATVVRGLALLALLVWVGVGSGPLSPAYAQDKQIVVAERNCDLTILPSGDVEVVETWKVRFQKGRFSRVMHTVPHEHSSGVTGWEVRGSGTRYTESTNEDSINYEPHTYTIRTDEEDTSITWYFPKTQNRTRTFTLRYTLQGAVRVYPNGHDVFSWLAVERTHAYPITASQVVIHLPGTYDADAVQGWSYRNQHPETVEPAIDGERVTFTSGSFDPGIRWDVRVQFPHGDVQAERPAWQTAAEHAFSDPTNAATVERRDRDLTITPNGEVQVVETWELDLTGGPFSNASFDIPHDRLTGLDGWSVREGEAEYQHASNQQAHTFDVVDKGDHTRLSWYFPVTTDQTRTFTIGYMVQGGVYIDAAGDQLSWALSEAERPYTVNAAHVTVHLPSAVASEQVEAMAECAPATLEPTIAPQAGGVTASGGPFEPDEACTLHVTFPHGSVTADPPPWQQALDQQQQQAEEAAQHQSLVNMLMMAGAGVFGLVLLVGLVQFWRKLPK